MLEVEAKFAVGQVADLERRLADAGAEFREQRVETDQYFNAPDRDFARTDEALRLRRIGSANFITYKGPRRDAQTKTRTEIEIRLTDGDDVAQDVRQMLSALGYRPVAVVCKQRRLYHLERDDFAVEVCLDDVERVGRYAELEIQAAEAQLEPARAVILRLAAELGLQASERRSYLELLLGGTSRQGTPAIARTVAEVRQAVRGARARGLTVGLVPTMGALHAGHVSLIEAARKETGFVVVSIFVNPTQFGPNEDLTRYPRPLQADLEMCARAGVDLVFHPELATVYPPGYHTYVEVHDLQDVLCGASRPGHFRGVATVVLKLFNIVQPDLAFFGQKDAQQVRIIQQLVRDLDVPVQLRVGPIVREADGLALSSRNQYLDADQRRQATTLHRALAEARALAAAGERDPQRLRQALIDRVEATPGARLDYAAVVDADTLRPQDRLGGATLVALAVHFGGTRLIDNLLLHVAPPSAGEPTRRDD